MRIHNFLPELIRVLEKWKKFPSPEELKSEYLRLLEPVITPILEDFQGRWEVSFYEILRDGVSWESYRKDTLLLDPEQEEARLRFHMKEAERRLGGLR
jgi:hypothetical protein